VRYPHVWAFVAGSPWAILPEKLSAILAVLELREAGEHLDAEEIRARIGAAADRGGPRGGGGVAVIPILGTISQRADLLTESSGGVSTERVTRSLRQAMADPSVGSILLDIDSPGGSVFGVQELADEIAAAAARKPVVAVANSLAASAAYWLASGASELVVTPSGEVGSIGVLAVHQDESALQEKMGVRTSLVTAGKYKGEGNPFEPLAAEARGALQSRVDEYYGSFTRAVARGRGTTVSAVRGGFGEGRVVGAREAVRLGMADRIDTLDNTLARLASGRWQVPQRAAATFDEPLMTADGEAVLVTFAPPTPESAAADPPPPARPSDARWRRLRLHEHAAR
jgi:signal peptide peptidase SppA